VWSICCAGGTGWRSWFRHCATNRKVAGSTPDGAILIFHRQSFRPRYGPSVDSASNRSKYQEYFLWGKGGRCVGLTTLPPSCADCLEIWDPERPLTLWAWIDLNRDCLTLQILRWVTDCVHWLLFRRGLKIFVFYKTHRLALGPIDRHRFPWSARGGKLPLISISFQGSEWQQLHFYTPSVKEQLSLALCSTNRLRLTKLMFWSPSKWRRDVIL